MADAPLPNQIQLPTDGTGKKLRTIEVTTIIAGVVTTVEMEVLSVSDDQGNVIKEFIDYPWQDEMLSEIKMIRIGIARLLDALDENSVLSPEDDD